MKKRILITLLLLLLSTNQCQSISYDELKTPKPHAYRVGTTDEIENKFEIESNLSKTDTIKAKEEAQLSLDKLTYADLSIKRLAKEISQSVDIDYDEMAADLSLLWQGAATSSDTVKFALYKLSNPDEDKPSNGAVKNVLSTIASVSTLVGAGMGNPALASAAMIGGNTLGIMSQDVKALNYKYSKVNDADMIILVRKIDELQQSVVTAYFDYITSRKVFDMAARMSSARHENYLKAQNSTKEVILITDAYYREALDFQIKARSEFYSKRATLEQLVGNDIFKQFEENINSRAVDNEQ